MNSTKTKISRSTSLSEVVPYKNKDINSLRECAHFHYEINTVELPNDFRATVLNNIRKQNGDICDEIEKLKTKNLNKIAIQVVSKGKKWFLSRTLENFRELDKQLHECIFDRKFSGLRKIENFEKYLNNHLNRQLSEYLNKFSAIALRQPINCGPILNWFEIDNKGERLYDVDDIPHTSAVAIVKKNYSAKSYDELSLEVGNEISIDTPLSSQKTSWLRGRKELEVGFFPAENVEVIQKNSKVKLQDTTTDKTPKKVSKPTKNNRLKRFLCFFMRNRPVSKSQLQIQGIIKQRLFTCDLGEHLINNGLDVPDILRICSEFIERYGLIDGIYRQSGQLSTVHKLANAFDEGRYSEIDQDLYRNDAHHVASVLKMYFRELPNPLFTYQLYRQFILFGDNLMSDSNLEQKVDDMYELFEKLPPPHYRTLAFLMRHLHKLSKHESVTKMNPKNLAIVWAPNLLRSKDIELSSINRFDIMYTVTLQANIVEFLISNTEYIFFESPVFNKNLCKSRDSKQIARKKISIFHDESLKVDFDVKREIFKQNFS